MIPGPHDASPTNDYDLPDTNLEAPGLHFFPCPQKEQPLVLKKTGISGFIGLTARGPDRKSIEIDGIDTFHRIFGGSPCGGLLETSIEAYFTNGGRRCFVCRVVARDARAASGCLRDTSGRTVLCIEALEKGSFGNDLSIVIKHTDVESVCNLDEAAEHHDSSRDSCTVDLWTEDRHINKGAAPLLEISINGSIAEQVPLTSDAPGCRSKLIKVISANLPALCNGTIMRMSGGRDAIDETAPADFTGSPGSFDIDESPLESLVRTNECDTLLAPDLFWLHSRAAELGTGPFFNMGNVQKVQKALLAAAARTGTTLAVLDAPPHCSEEEAVSWFHPLQSRYAAAYFPWAISQSGAEIPASPSIVGMMARMDREVGPHLAPANIKLSYLAGLVSFMNTKAAARLAAGGVNCLVENHGIRPWATVTTNSSELSTIRFINAVRRTLEADLAWAAFEPNEPALWKRISRRLSAFARELHMRGMLAGETAEQAWQIKCDAETNPHEEIAAGRVHAFMDLAPVKPAKFIRIAVGIDSAI